MIALLCVLSRIVHIAITLPTWWLAGSTEDLANFDFGVLDMGKVIDLLEKAMVAVVEDGKLLLDEDFMMNIFLIFKTLLTHLRNTLIFCLRKRQALEQMGHEDWKTKCFHLTCYAPSSSILHGERIGKHMTYDVNWLWR